MKKAAIPIPDHEVKDQLIGLQIELYLHKKSQRRNWEEKSANKFTMYNIRIIAYTNRLISGEVSSALGEP